MSGGSLSRHEREIGEVVAVSSIKVVVAVHEDITSAVHSYPGGQSTVAQVGAYFLFPIGAGEAVVGVLIGAYQHEGYEPDPRSGMTLQLAKPRRTLHVNLLGTLSGDNAFRHGIAVYPTLGTTAVVPSREQLKAILYEVSTESGDAGAIALAVGSSPIYETIDIAASLDDLFARPLALVGNTGSGKSWTAAATMQRCIRTLRRNAQICGQSLAFHPKFIILDINGEYQTAFDRNPSRRIPNEVYVNGRPFGLPLWTFQFQEFTHYFGAAAAAQTQIPVLERIVTFAREDAYDESHSSPGGDDARAMRRRLRRVERAQGFLRALVGQTRATEGPYIGTKARGTYENLRMLIQFDSVADELYHSLDEVLRQKTEKVGQDLEQSDLMKYVKLEKGRVLQAGEVADPYDALPQNIADMIQELSDCLDPLLEQLYDRLVARAGLPTITADSPYPFDPSRLDQSDLFDLALSGMRGEERVREYVATMRLRIRRMLQDRRWSVFREGQEQQFEDIIDTLIDRGDVGGEVVIIDCSMLSHDVLPFFCSVVGRLLLDLREYADPEERITRPWVLVLEEAHNYLRPRREGEYPGLTLSRETFERIAKEGRKFGMSLVIASQRPSDVSETALSQCANFIAHRIQNPDDIEYFKRILPGGSREILDQVSVLVPGEALLMGSAVNVPCRVKIWPPEPTPHSETPRPSHGWRSDQPPFDHSKAIANWLSEGEQASTRAAADSEGHARGVVESLGSEHDLE